MAEPHPLPAPPAVALNQRLLTDFSFIISGSVLNASPVQHIISAPIIPPLVIPPAVIPTPVQVIVTPPVPVSPNWDSSDEDESDVEVDSDTSTNAVSETPVQAALSSAMVLLDSPAIISQGPYWKEQNRIQQMLGSRSLDGALYARSASSDKADAT